MIRHVIQIALRIGAFKIDRRRSDLVSQSHYADARFESSGAAQQVPGHRLGRTDRDFSRRVAKYALQSGGFNAVANGVEVP